MVVQEDPRVRTISIPVKGDLAGALVFSIGSDGTTVAAVEALARRALDRRSANPGTKPVKLPTVIMSGRQGLGAEERRTGRYAMVYNPVNDSMRRYPLAIVTGER